MYFTGLLSQNDCLVFIWEIWVAIGRGLPIIGNRVMLNDFSWYEALVLQDTNNLMHKKIVFSMGILLSLFFGKAKAQDAVRQDTLGYYRKQIDTLDQQIIDLLGERMKAARAIGIYKLDHQIGVVQSARFEEVLRHAIQRGKERQLSEAFIRALYNDVHQESIHQQEVLQAERKKQ